MARLVIGTSKAKTVPAVVKEVGPEHYIEKTLDANGKLLNGSTIISFDGVIDLGESVLRQAYYYNSSVSGVVNFPDLENVTGASALFECFYHCSGITGVSFPKLETITANYCFQSAFGYTGITSVSFPKLKTVNGTNCFSYAFSNSPITSLSFDELETINGNGPFINICYMCSGLKSALFPKLKTISLSSFASCFNDSSFYYCPLETIDFHSLETVNGAAFGQVFKNKTTITGNLDLSKLKTVSGNGAFKQCFNGCSGITGLDLSSLETINGSDCFSSAFSGIRATGVLSFPSLRSITGNSACAYMFTGAVPVSVVKFQSLNSVKSTWCMGNFLYAAPNLTDMYFYALDTNSFGSYTNQFNGMLGNTSGVTVHFPMRIQATIGSWADVTAGFGGTNTTVLFDIVTSLTGADTNTYARQEKDSTATATAWVYNDTLYYTSGATEPSVGNNIYSDSACSIVATTVSAIA